MNYKSNVDLILFRSKCGHFWPALPRYFNNWELNTHTLHSILISIDSNVGIVTPLAILLVNHTTHILHCWWHLLTPCLVPSRCKSPPKYLSTPLNRISSLLCQAGNMEPLLACLGRRYHSDLPLGPSSLIALALVSPTAPFSRPQPLPSLSFSSQPVSAFLLRCWTPWSCSSFPADPRRIPGVPLSDTQRVTQADNRPNEA